MSTPASQQGTQNRTAENAESVTKSLSQKSESDEILQTLGAIQDTADGRQVRFSVNDYAMLLALARQLQVSVSEYYFTVAMYVFCASFLHEESVFVSYGKQVVNDTVVMLLSQSHNPNNEKDDDGKKRQGRPKKDD